MPHGSSAATAALDAGANLEFKDKAARRPAGCPHAALHSCGRGKGGGGLGGIGRLASGLGACNTKQPNRR